MPKNWINRIVEVNVPGDSIPDIEDVIRDDSPLPKVNFTDQYQQYVEQVIKSNRDGATFLNKVGWFFTGKTRAGKIFHRVLGVAVPVVGGILGVPTDLLTDLTTSTLTNGATMPAIALDILGLTLEWSSILGVIGGLVVYLAGYLAVKARGLGTEVGKLLKLIAEAIAKESPSGSELTPEERKVILDKFLLIGKIIWQKYGQTWAGRLLGVDAAVNVYESKQLEK